MGILSGLPLFQKFKAGLEAENGDRDRKQHGGGVDPGRFLTAAPDGEERGRHK